MKKLNHLLFVLISALGVVSIAPDSQARSQFGVRIGSYTDMEEFYVGADLLAPVGAHTYVNPNIEYVLIDYGTYLTTNLDLHYDFATRSRMYFWLGGGLGLAYFSPEGNGDSNSELAVNLLGGIGFNTRGSFVPYIQAKAILGDADDFVITFGLRF